MHFYAFVYLILTIAQGRELPIISIFQKAPLLRSGSSEPSFPVNGKCSLNVAFLLETTVKSGIALEGQPSRPKRELDQKTSVPRRVRWEETK